MLPFRSKLPPSYIANVKFSVISVFIVLLVGSYEKLHKNHRLMLIRIHTCTVSDFLGR